MNFLKLLLMRAAWWAGTGGVIGFFSGIVAGALHGFAAIILAFSVTLYVRFVGASPILDLLRVLFFLGISGVLLGAIIGCISGILVFLLLSCSPHRHEWRTILHRLRYCVEKKSLQGSFIGALCGATSATLLMLILRQSFDLLTIVMAYGLGAIGGFAVGLFLGARNIIRENAAQTSSTRSAE